MKRGLIGKITAIAALMLCFALIFLAACGGGGSSDDGNSGGNSTSTVDGGGSSIGTVDGGGSSDSGNRGFTEAVNDVKEALTGSGNSLTIYKVGSDLIAFALKGDMCYRLMPKGEWEESDTRITLRNDDYSGQVQFSTFSAYCYWRAGEEQFNASSDYGGPMITEDSYFAAISYPDICDALDLTGELTLESFNSSLGGENEILAKVEGNKAVKSVGLEEFVDEIAEYMGVGIPKGQWAGSYKSDGYGAAKGFVTVTVTEHGGIVIDCDLDLDDRTYVGFEKIPEGWDHDDPDYMYRHFQMLNGFSANENKRVEFQYSRHIWGSGDTEDSLTWTYDDWSENGNGYKGSTLNRFKETHVAPEGYRDEDYNGYIARRDPDDDKYFKPASDDYIINCSINTTVEDLECDYYNLTSFDKNGFLLDYGVTKYVFKSASDAETFVAKRNSNYNKEYYKTDRSDNIVYIAAKEEAGYRTTGSKTAQMSYSGSDWYVNCHYLYGWKRDDGTYGSITYVSKPYTEKEFKISLEDQVYWDAIPQDHLNSSEPKGATMDYSIGDYTYFSFYGSELVSPAEIHITGRTVTGAALNSYWEDGKLVYYLIFTEILFGDETAEVTQYIFRLDDMYSTEVNFDNFKTVTPTHVVKQIYDIK